MKKTLALLLCALLTFALVPVVAIPASATGATVVYLKDGGTGDGSSAENAVGTLTDAFNALDLTQDCTVVVCGAFAQTADFNYGSAYTGSVTFTSKYGGTDYAASGAVYNAAAKRYYSCGKAIFEDITINLTGGYWLVVAQDNPFKIGENVTTTFQNANTKGLGVASALSILAGYQGTNKANAEEEKAVTTGNAKVEVYSGEKILIVAGNRQLWGTNRTGGTVDIAIGGTAKVGALYLCSVNFAELKDGDITVTLKDSASIEKVGASLNPDNVIKSLTFNWLGGTINDSMVLTSGSNIAALANSAPAETVYTTYTNGAKLNSNATTQAAANYAEISALFASSAPAAPAKIELPARPVLTNTTDKTYLAYDIPAGLGDDIKALHVKDSKNHGYYDLASAALTSGGTIVVTQKALFSFSMSDTRNTIDGTKGTVLVTAQDGETNYINTATDTKETGILLGNNNFKEANWSKVDYLRVAGDVIFDNIVFFNRAHKNADGNLAPMDEPNTVLALAGSRVVIGSGAQFLSRAKSGDTPLNLPNMALATEEGSVVFLDTLGFSKYTGKGTLVINKDLVSQVSADTFAGFEGNVVDEEGNALFATAPATGSATVVIAAVALLASFGAIVALKKREER